MLNDYTTAHSDTIADIKIAKKSIQIMPLTHIIILCTLNCINMILSDFFDGGEASCFNYLKDKSIITLYYILLV